MTKKQHMKIMNKATIKIFFRDGKVYEIHSRLWDDYEVNGDLFCVKRKGAWIGIYKMDIIDCIVVG